MSDEQKKSYELIKFICAAFKGTLEEHQQLQKALSIVEQAMIPQPILPKKEGE